ncbi:hypothetical protein GGI07_000885 [Coemansia sp. Benny D115]|nr:hypothetical protein GGI07_000885 [Coemansia sp. Benny D115]
MATNGASTPATTLERPEHEHEHGPVSVPESEREPEPESDAMQVDNEAPGPLVNGNADSAELLANSKLDTPTRKNPNFASHHRELPATLQMSGVGSNNLLVAPSPISSGRVTKRRAIRQKQSALAGKQASKAGSSMQVVAQEDDRMSLDSFALRPLVRLPRQSTPRPSPATQLEEIQALNLPDPPSPLFLKRKSSDVDMDMPLLKARSLTPEAPHKVQEVASLDIDGIAEVDFEEEDDDQQQQHQQLIGTKPMRFKAPKNARVQTFEIDEDDQQPEQHHALLDKRMSTDASATQSLEQEETQSYFSTPVKTAASNISMYPQTPTAQALYPNGDATDRLQMTPMRTPQRKAMGGAADEMPLGAPHSPARMVTPHRVVYSPVNPRTVMKSRKSTVMDTDALDQQKIPQTPAPAKKSAVSTPAALPTTAKAKSNSRTSDQIEPGMSGRRSTVGGDLEPEFEETRVPFLPARRYVQKAHIFAACGQTAPIDWATGGLQACGVLLPEIDPANHTEAQMSEIESEAGLCKIGEATYSEVFSAQWRYVPRTRYDKFNSKKGKVKGERLMQVALKVIPFGNSAVKLGTGEPQTTLRDLYQEIGATLALSRLSERERAKLQDARLQVKMPLKPKERELGANFVKAFRVCICQGSLPAPLLRAWDRWKTEYPDLCENIRPDYYPANQLFAVFVLEMGGETLENATVSTWKEARSIIRQLALSMALAERNNRFEHRDLHWGNIMVTRYNSNLTFLYQLPPIGSRQKSTLLSIPSYKLRCTIIDYTLSRLHIDNDTADIADSKQPANYNPANNVFYVALKDEALFRGKGDIQFDVYRQMRECSKAQWDGFHPHTNVLWLTYVLQKILLTKSPNIRNELMSFAESKLGPSFAAAPTELKRAASQELLRRWVSEFEKCESSSQVLKCALLDLYKGQ